MLSKQLNLNPRYSKLYTWGKLITITGGAQAVVQGAGLICGILIIRMLSTEEYAIYTLANTMLGAMTVLADGGISSGVMSQGGKVWQNKKNLGIVLTTGLHLRQRFAVISCFVVTPILIYLMQQHGANWITILLVIAALIPALYAALSDSLLEIVPKLHQDIKPLQKNQMGVSVGRLVLCSIALFVFPWAFVAILGNGIPRIFGNLRLRKIALKFAADEQEPDKEVRAAILKSVRRIMPGAIYYCISGQITIWLISIFGNTTSVAQVGALGRFSMLLNIFSVLISTLVIPRFARIKVGPKALAIRFLQIQASIIILNSLIVFIVWLFPEQILWILGKGYSDLNRELVYSIIGGCCSLMAGVSFSLFVSRGWAIHPAISIPISLLSIIASIFIFDISTVTGVLYMNIFTSVIQYLINTAYCSIKISKSSIT